MKDSIATLIDADSITYICSWNLREVEDIEICHQQVDSFVRNILDKTNCSYYLGFVGGSKCFRHTIFPEYKSTRKDKPEWVQKWEIYIRQRLIEYWKFIVCDSIEAEDGLAICSEYYKDKTNLVLAFIDKDLQQLPGNRFNYKTHEFSYSDVLGRLELVQKKKVKKLIGTGRMWLYAQIMLGDSTDCIPSMKRGCGDVYVYNLLKDCTTEYQLKKKVYSEYLKYSSKEAFILNRQLVSMLTKESFGFMIPEPIEFKKKEIDIFNL